MIYVFVKELIEIQIYFKMKSESTKLCLICLKKGVEYTMGEM